MTKPASLLSIIGELGYASEEDLREVQPRQVIYGGDQELNLFELGLVNEEQLLTALAAHTHLPSSPPGYLNVDSELSRWLAEEGAPGVAGRSSAGLVRVFVAVLPSEAERDKISNAVGDAFELYIATRLRIDEAKAHLQGGALSVRESSLLEKFGPRPMMSEDSLPPASLPPVENKHAIVPPQSGDFPEIAEAPHPIRPMFSGARSLSDQPGPVAETGPPPQNYEQVAVRASLLPPAPVASEPPAPNTYPLEHARRDLDAAKSRDRVVDVLLEFASQSFEYTAVFAIVSDEARGLKSIGVGTGTEALRALKIPLDLPSAFRTARDTSVQRITKLKAAGLEGGITRDLDRPSGRDVFLLPIAVRGRAVLLLWGDRGKKNVDLNRLGDLITFAPAVSDTLERVLLARKRASRVAQPVDRLPQPVDQLPSPPLDAPPVAPEPKLSRTRGMSAFAGEAPSTQHKPTHHKPTQRNPAAPPAGLQELDRNPKDPSHKIADAPKRALNTKEQSSTTDSDPPSAFPVDPPRTLRGFPSIPSPKDAPPFAPAPAERALEKPKARPPLLSRRIVPLEGRSTKKDPASQGVEEDARVAARGRSEVEPPEPSRFAPEPENEPVEVEPLAEAPPPPEALPPPIAPPPPLTIHDDPPRMSAKGTLMSRRPPISEPDESGWESPGTPAVVRLTGNSGTTRTSGNSCTELVQLLVKGDRTVIPKLVDNGETAVGALIARFPGPVTEPETAQTPASACGPILEALAALGSKSIPFLTVRTADEDPKVRRWATYLLGELPGKDSAKAIAGRLLDDALEVRRAALASARRARKDVVTRRTLRSHMEGLCRDKHLSADARCAAIEALADIREHEAIPTLLQLLDDTESSVVRATRWALSVLTRQDFGADNAAWKKFWQDNRDLDRVEWLIQSLSHEQRDLRRAAGDELTAMAGKSFGFQEDQPEGQRRAAQAEFRNWWETIGKSELRSRS